MTTERLRERKKRRTRELIAATAARLFAEHGYERVSVLDVASAAEVSEQTVYNYFPTKSALVLDRDDVLRDQLTTLIANRPSAVSPAAAIRDAALSMVEELRTMNDTQVRGGLGYLSIRSPAVRRLALEMTDRHADAIAVALADGPDRPALPVAKVHAIALAWVFQTITDECGRGTAAGLSPAQIAKTLAPAVTAILDQLDAWPSSHTLGTRGRRLPDASARRRRRPGQQPPH